jgi:hypothetical protein
MSFDIDLRGEKEVQDMLASMAGRQLANRLRRMVRAGAAVFRSALRDEARSRGDLPASFAKTRTKAHRNPIGVSVSVASPLVNIFEHGAVPHPIGGGGQLLANLEAGFVARGPVQHPGMAARPIYGPAFAAGHDDAEDAVDRELWEGVR